MKKMIALLLALIMVFSLVACSGSADTASHCGQSEGAPENAAEGIPQRIPAQDQKDHATKQIQPGQGQDQALGCFADAVNATQNYDSRQSGSYQTTYHRRHSEPIPGSTGKGVDLCQIAHTQGRQHTASGKGKGKGTAAHAPLQIGKGTAAPAAVLTPVPEQCSQHIFRIHQQHAQNGGDPHPENRPWSPQGERCCHSHNVPGTHGGGKGGGHGLQLRNPAAACRPAPAAGKGTAQYPSHAPELKAAHTDCVIQPGAQQQAQQQIAPDECIDGFQHSTLHSRVSALEFRQKNVL